MDLSHGSPGQSDIPSIAAVVSSRQWPLNSKHRASVRTRSPKVEMTDSLFERVSETEDDGIIRELLLDFCMSSGKRKPDQIIIFRQSQGAFGNMCRGGHMFAPTKIWHRKVNLNVKRYAVASAIAASAVASPVLARGHRIESVPELPLVISDSAEIVEKTSAALKVLKQIGAYPDVEKAKDSLGIRPGEGKMRNRRHINRKGPLIVYRTECATFLVLIS